MKTFLVLLHLLFKVSPLARSIDIANLLLPLKVATVHALTWRDALGLTASWSVPIDIAMLSVAAVLTGLLLWPKSGVPSAAR